jgi:hypothetical protein
MELAAAALLTVSCTCVQVSWVVAANFLPFTDTRRGLERLYASIEVDAVARDERNARRHQLAGNKRGNEIETPMICNNAASDHCHDLCDRL